MKDMHCIKTAEEATMRSMKKMLGTALTLAAVVGMTAPAVNAQTSAESRARARRTVEALAVVEARETVGVLAIREAQAALAVVEPMLARAPMGVMGSQVRAALEMAQAELAAQRYSLPQAQMALSAARPQLAQARELARVERAVAVATRGTRGALAGLGSRSSYETRAPEAWLQEDPGTEAYQAAREDLNRRRYERAAAAFAALRRAHPRSGYVADSFYWQAFALSREAGRQNLREAAELLAAQAAEYPDANTRRDASELMVRVEAQLARSGDARAAAAIAQQATDPCGDEQEIRMAALSALLNMNSEQAVPILEEVLRSRDECSVELRRRAVFLLSQKMSDGTVDLLLDLAHRNPDPDPEVREQAIFWLHQVDTPEALDALQAILTESDDPQMQERAIFAISQRGGDERAIEILKEYAMRTDIDVELRQNAIFSISQHPDAGGAAFLIELYPQLDGAELRENAIFGIAQSGGEEARGWLMERALDTGEGIEVRKNALFWAGQMGEVQADELRQIYRTVEDIEMKEQVIFVASQRSETEIVDFLMEVARDEDDAELRQNAVFWLGQSKDPRIAEFLLSLIRR